LETVADAQAAMGYPEASFAVAQEELTLLQGTGANTKNQMLMMEKVAQIAMEQGQKLEALTTMESIIKLCKDAGDKTGEAQKTLQTAEMHSDMNHTQDALRLAKDAEELFAALGDTVSLEEAKKLQTMIYVKRGQYAKAPHRSEALLALKSFIKAVEQRDEQEVKKFEAKLDRASAAIKDTEMSSALEALFQRDPTALQFLEKLGWDLEAFHKPVIVFQYPHKGFYLGTTMGGMGFGPQFRSVNPYRVGRQADELNMRACSVSFLPETESWQSNLLYRHGIMDSGFQSQSIFQNEDGSLAS
jgi:tetratricopeptide (TPR) repeat protein